MDLNLIIVIMAIIQALSFNMTGYQTGVDYLRDTIHQADPLVVFLQETWHLTNACNHLGHIDSNYLFIECSGVDSSDTILRGRPSGGVAILYKKSIAGSIIKINTSSKRVCAVILNSKDGLNDVLFINVYMPCDTFSNTSCSDAYLETLNAIDQLICKYPNARLLIGGDWNTDPSRLNAQTRVFMEFTNRNNLTLCWNSPVAKQDFTYVNHSLGHSSCLDHFLVSKTVLDDMNVCKVLDSPLNASNHNIVNLSFKCDFEAMNTSDRQFESDKIAWHKVSDNDINNYKNCLDTLLDGMQLPTDVIHCDDVNCKCDTHVSQINDLCASLIDACLKAGNECFPKVSPAGKRLPGWNEHVEPLRQDSLFWHAVWTSSGRPPTGELARLMRYTRAKYHKAVKEIKREKEQKRFNRMAESFQFNENRQLWSEIKRMKKSNKVQVNCIDGHTCDKEIACHLGHKYQNVFSSSPTSQSEKDDVISQIQDKIDNDVTSMSVITVSDVLKAIRSLNANKSDGMRGTSSDHIILASHRFFVVFNTLVNAMLVHGHSSEDLLISILVSIPKDSRASMVNSDNYRGIALSSALGKIIDYILLEKYEDELSTSGLQFAYKHGHSTVMCTSILKEVVMHYNSNGSDVYACLLDASKAFDRVNHGKLFELLLNRNLPGVVLRLLFDLYSRQYVYTQWNGELSQPISMLNGVKQGGVLSPILFCIYMDELLTRLKNTGVGCYMGHHYLGSLGYADDLKLLCPTIAGLQTLVDTCQKFALDFDLLFNTKKTHCICYSSKPPDNLRPVFLNGVSIPWQPQVKYLGTIFVSNLSDQKDISQKKSIFISYVNRLNSIFSKAPVELKVHLLQVYCSSWYGCQAWQLDTRDTSAMNTAWQIAIRRTMHLPARTRSILLPVLAGNANFSQQHHQRVYNMLYAMKISKNPVINFVFERGIESAIGILGRNHVYLCQMYGYQAYIKRSRLERPAVADDVAARVSQIRELLLARDGRGQIEHMNSNDIENVLGFVCTY